MRTTDDMIHIAVYAIIDSASLAANALLIAAIITR